MLEISIADLSNPVHSEAVIKLLDEYAQDEMGGLCELSDFVKENLITELAKRTGVYVILAMDDTKPVGLAICFEGLSTFACKPLLNIHDIVVTQAYRGQGISKQLLSKAEEIAYTIGCCKLTLEVLEGNAVAQAAYTGFGFSGYQLKAEHGKALFWQKKLT